MGLWIAARSRHEPAPELDVTAKSVHLKMMRRSVHRTALVGLAALALAVSAVGPCHCLLANAACHQETRETDAHACCEKPQGVQAAAGECCETGPDLVLANSDVPEIAPPTPQASPIRPTLPGERSACAAVVRTPPPLALDRTTVLLI